jgi:hypothetical protein
MWDLLKSFSIANQIGVVGAFIGFAVGMGAVFLVDWRAGIIITTLCTALLVFCLWFFFGPEVRRRNLQKRGVRAWATILEVRETGITVQGNYPMPKIHFRVEPDGGEPYETWAKCLISRFEIPTFQPGGRVEVLIDPKHPKKVTLA